MKIQVLGAGCAKCKNLHKTVEEAVKKIGLNLEVEYSTDIAEMVRLGAMASPVLAIDGEVITAGKIPSQVEIEKIIKEKIKGKEIKKEINSRGGCSCGGKC